MTTTVGELLRRVAAEVPDRVALVDGSAPLETRRRWTYAELLTAAERVAGNLLERFDTGERVAVWGSNSPEWIITQLGAALAGVVLVAVDPAYRTSELAYILGQSNAAGIVHDDTGRGFSRAEVIAELRPNLPELREVLDLLGPDLLGKEPPAVALPRLDPTSTVQIQYTSGTTGFPKGAELHHLAVVNTSFYCARRAGFADGGVWANMLPLSHIAGCITATIGPLSHRGTVVILNRFDPAQVLQTIEEEQCTLTLAVPTMLIAMLEDPDFGNRDLGTLRAVISGAATVPVELVERVKNAFDCGFSIVYGMTEGPIVLQTHLTDSPQDQSETIGQPQANVELAIVDPHTHEFLPCGNPGEIWIRAYSVMNGYYRNPEATRATVTEDGWLRTGDLATMDERGFVRITGRLKDMIIRGGENLYAREIEELVFTHPAVADVAVIGVPDEKLGEIVAAVVRVRDGGRLPVEELYEYCADRLAYAKVPVLWAAVDQFPLTPSGKIRKHVLRAQVVEGAIPVVPVEVREGVRYARDAAVRGA
ncbi:AMP-binding protein [Prauserella flavalba]|uniref:AMP-binding protein n=1 Tax=Prauserella flavalba TaxID=1477506 RepID=UPI001FEA053A|nr:AMP-binding protein [Prauserella flavalba]